jgi:16S rRNA (cytosine1402-N4)-methyltransferase
LEEVLAVLAPQPGEVIVDCTAGWAGHAVELLKCVGPHGRLLGIDLDRDNLPYARERLQATGLPFILHHGNFAALQGILLEEGLPAVDMLLTDLGMSSMQVDDPERGFSYIRDGPLDMRMDRTRGRTAAQLLATISRDELVQALRDLGDEPEAERIANALVEARQQAALQRTEDLAHIIMEATQTSKKIMPWRLHPAPQRWNLHPAARTFQVLRILVNRELANLQQLLRVLPECLKPGGRTALISFHSGEDRLVKAAFRAGLQAGVYASVSPEPIRAGYSERTANPRARSAKLRWARKTATGSASGAC